LEIVAKKFMFEKSKEEKKRKPNLGQVDLALNRRKKLF